MIGFPLLLIPFAIYNIFVFLMPGVAFTTPVVDVHLISGATWAPTFGDALLTVGALLLMIEVIKAARPGARYLMDHLLSLILLGAAVAEFVLLAPFATSTFFLLTVLMAVEFLAGVSFGIRNRRRPAAIPEAFPAAPASDIHDRTPASPAPAPSEPSFEPVPESVSVTPKPAVPMFEPAAREPQFTPQPEPAPAAPTVALQPEPPVVVVDPPEPQVPASAPAPASSAPPAERKLATWSLADLVSDHESDRTSSPKP